MAIGSYSGDFIQQGVSAVFLTLSGDLGQKLL